MGLRFRERKTDLFKVPGITRINRSKEPSTGWFSATGRA